MKHQKSLMLLGGSGNCFIICIEFIRSYKCCLENQSFSIKDIWRLIDFLGSFSFIRIGLILLGYGDKI